MSELEYASEIDGSTKMSMARSNGTKFAVDGSKVQFGDAEFARQAAQPVQFRPAADCQQPDSVAAAPNARKCPYERRQVLLGPKRAHYSDSQPGRRRFSRLASGPGMEHREVDSVVVDVNQTAGHAFFGRVPGDKLAVHHHPVHHPVSQPQQAAVTERCQVAVGALARYDDGTPRQTRRGHGERVHRHVESAHECDSAARDDLQHAPLFASRAVERQEREEKRNTGIAARFHPGPVRGP
jgi:hypothetical protein